MCKRESRTGQQTKRVRTQSDERSIEIRCAGNSPWVMSIHWVGSFVILTSILWTISPRHTERHRRIPFNSSPISCVTIRMNWYALAVGTIRSCHSFSTLGRRRSCRSIRRNVHQRNHQYDRQSRYRMISLIDSFLIHSHFFFSSQHCRNIRYSLSDACPSFSFVCFITSHWSFNEL